MAHQIFRSSCSITPLAVPRRCRSASWRQKGVERIGCWACAAQVHQKTQSKGKIGRAEMALTLINKLYGIERDMEEAGEPPSHVHMTKASPVSSRYVMPTHDGVLTVSVRQSIVFPKGA